jgi:hypothetical protein
MKFLFLDIDSVMVVWDYTKADPPRNRFNTTDFTTECVTSLNEILESTGCEIILSSDHRWNHSLDELDEIFKHNGCIKSPINITPLSKRFNSMDLDNMRAHEIMMFLEKNPVDNWVAVDDLDLDINIFKEEMNGHFAHTLNGIHLVKDKIIELLNR